MREALQRAVDAICVTMSFPGGHALLINDDEPGLAKSAHIVHVKDKDRLAKLFEMSSRMTWPNNLGAPGEVLRSGKPFFGDTAKEMQTPERYPRARACHEAGLRGSVVLPVLVDNKVEAIIEFACEEPMASDGYAADTLVAVAERLSRFFERRRAQIRFLKQKEELQASAEQLFAMAGRLVDSQEEERRRIAREIHDDFTQRLAFVSMKIGNLAGRERGSTSEERDADLEDVRKATAAVAADLRDLSRQLHPAMLELLGLTRAMRAHCEDFQRARGIETTFKNSISDSEASSQAGMCLYRVLQESLMNVSKHSGSPTAHVSLCRLADQIEMRIRDEGRGFDPVGEVRQGIGLRSMEERVRLLEGTLTIDSKPGSGTEIVLRIPAAQKQ
jgi:signal transduction histidine kinase